MGRAKTFTDKMALEKAMFLFWRQGYEQTSINELLKEMNLLNGSFYHSFGSKKKLFLKALEAYEEDFINQRNMLFNSPTTFPKKIKILFFHVLERQDSPCPRGCFLFNSVASDVLSHQEFKDQIAHMIKRFEDFLHHQLELATKNQEIKPLFPNKVIAGLLITYMQGLIKRCTLDFDHQGFKKQTELMLMSLGLGELKS